MYNLGTKIANLRKENNMTQNDLAEALGVSSQAVSKWEIGSSYPDISLIPKIAKLLGVSTDYLLNDEIEPKVKMQNLTVKKDVNELIFKINILDADGSKVNINLPIGFFKLGFNILEGMNFNGKLNNESIKNIDFDALIKMAEKGVLGKIVEVEETNGDKVSIYIE